MKSIETLKGQIEDAKYLYVEAYRQLYQQLQEDKKQECKGAFVEKTLDILLDFEKLEKLSFEIVQEQFNLFLAERYPDDFEG